MNVFSLCFIFVWAISIMFYYAVTKKHQWIILLCASVFLYIVSVQGVPLVLITVLGLTYVASRYICFHKEKGDKSDRKLRIIRNVVISLCIIALVIGRHTNYIVSLGNSYFTLKAIGYLIDCERYDDREYYENNIFFYALYLIFFPAIAQGPFNRYKDFKLQFKGKPISFDYVRFMHGIQRFLWGAMKKLVIASRLQDIGGFVFDDVTGKSGLTLIIGIVAQTAYYYMDFSSYMDMMIGISSSFGIDIPENFRQPFFSTSIAEFWRRWHITLGGWLKDYIMMPFIQSKMGRWLKKSFKKYGKDASRNAPLVIGTFVVWFLTYLWHGTGLNNFLWGMYYCVIIVVSLILDNKYKKIKGMLHVNDKSWWYRTIAMIRTGILVLIANYIQIAGGFKEFIFVFRQLIGKSFFIGERISLETLGWYKQDVFVLVMAMLLVFAISILKEKEKDILKSIDSCYLPARWSIYYILIFAVLILGRYGTEYDTSNFLYTNF